MASVEDKYIFDPVDVSSLFLEFEVEVKPKVNIKLSQAGPDIDGSDDVKDVAAVECTVFSAGDVSFEV